MRSGHSYSNLILLLSIGRRHFMSLLMSSIYCLLLLWVTKFHTRLYIINLFLTLILKYSVAFVSRIYTSTTNKLSPRSTPFLFLGYPLHHRDYRCLDLKTNRIIISRHVVFDENSFPKAEKVSFNPRVFDFLETDNPSKVFQDILLAPQPTESVSVPPKPTPATTNNAPSQPPIPVQRMTMGSQVGVHKPKKFFSLYTSSLSRIPTSHQKALLDPNWNPSMTDEYDAQIKNKTWSLVPRPYGANIINSLWLYKHKYDADEIHRRHKARLVDNGKTQQAGVD